MTYVPNNTDYPAPVPFPGAIAPPPPPPAPTSGLAWFDVEVSWGGQWVRMHDHLNYQISGDSFAQSQVTWRKISADSPVAEGSYLIHAVKGLVTDRILVYVYGQDHNEMNENLGKIEALFSQLEYRIRITFDDYREYWRCQPADYAISRNHTFAHNVMAQVELAVPRFPTVTRELIA